MPIQLCSHKPASQHPGVLTQIKKTVGDRKDWVKLHGGTGECQMIATPPSHQSLEQISVLLTSAQEAQKSQLPLPVVVDHAYVIEPHKGSTCPYC